MRLATARGAVVGGGCHESTVLGEGVGEVLAMPGHGQALRLQLLTLNAGVPWPRWGLPLKRRFLPRMFSRISPSSPMRKSAPCGSTTAIGPVFGVRDLIMCCSQA